MKNIRIFLMALTCGLLSSCMGSDYAGAEYDETPYGNNAITESNVMTIAALKSDSRYKNVIANSAMKTITDDIQIKGYVTGNDVQGNIYNEFALQDNTGALIVSVAQGGLNGYLPVGQEVLIDLNGMVIGGYGAQCEIGGIYTNPNTGAQSVGRMNRADWAKHYKLIGTADASVITPERFDVSKISDADYLKDNSGKLMTIYGVTLAEANGVRTFAPNDSSATITANCVNRSLSEYSSLNIVLRTSTYADFANAVMPTGKVNITGIFTRYRNTWQILMRTLDDIESATSPFEGLPGTGEGTEESPFNITRALSVINNNLYDSSKEYYVSGIISEIQEVSTTYHNATYKLSDDGTSTNQLTVYRGKYLNGADFTDVNQISVGQSVVVLGSLTLYGTTPEIGTGSSIISIQ